MRVWLRHWLADLTGTFKSAANHRSHSVERERQRLQAILHAAGEGIVFTNHKMVIEYVNPALEQLTGYTK